MRRLLTGIALTLLTLPTTATVRYQATDLFAAVRTGDTAAITEILQAGVPVNSTDPFGETPLFTAIRARKNEAVLLLLERGADVRHTNRSEEGVIHAASFRPDGRIIRKLIQAGADKSIRNRYGETPYDTWQPYPEDKSPLNWSILLHDSAYFIKELNSYQREKTPALMRGFAEMAARNDSIEVFSLLLDTNIPELVSDGHKDIFAVAVRSGSTSVAKAILGRDKELKWPKNRHPYVRQAAESGSLSLMKLLLESGFPVNPPAEGDAESALGSAGTPAMAELLLRQGAHLSGRTFEDTPLYAAVKQNHTAVAEFLLSRKAPIDSPERHGRTLLHLAATHDNLHLFMALHAAGAPYRTAAQQTGRQITPLQAAAAAGACNIIRYILDNKLDTGSADAALTDAVAEHRMEAAQLLYTAGARHRPDSGSGKTLLHIAADRYRYGSPLRPLIRWLIALGIPVNVPDAAGNTPLHYAVQSGSDTVAVLIENGADLNAKNQLGETPLFPAVRKGDLRIIKILKQHGAGFHARNTKQETVLHAAARSERNLPDILPYLIKAGVNPAARDIAGDTIADIALQKDDLQLVETLISSGVTDRRLRSPSIENRRFAELIEAYTPEIFESGKVFARARTMLQAGVDINTPIDEGSTILHQAIDRYPGSNIRIIRELLDLGADPFAEDQRGITPLRLAFTSESPELITMVVRAATGVTLSDKHLSVAVRKLVESGALQWNDILDSDPWRESRYAPHWNEILRLILNDNMILVSLYLESGMDINRGNSDGITPLHAASALDSWPYRKKNSDSIATACRWIRFLLDSGADAGKPDKDGITPLMYAARTGNVPALRSLIAAGADVNACDHSGYTALMWACRYRHTDCVGLLVSRGADADVRASDGATAAILAHAAGDPALRKHFPATISDNDRKTAQGYQLIAAILRNDPNAVSEALAAGADMNFRGQYGMTPLLWSLTLSDAEAIQKNLIAGGAEVNCKTENGVTPLMLSQKKASEPVVRMLLDAGAEVNARDRSGKTAAVYAMQTYRSYDKLTLLLERGADFNGQTESGTPYVFFMQDDFMRLYRDHVNSGTPIRCDLNARDGLGRTVLLFAAYARWTDDVLWLLEQGADINARDSKGRSALAYAEAGDQARTVASLSERGLNHTATSRIMLGDSSFRMRKFREALKWYDAALQANPNADIAVRYVAALTADRQYAEAIRRGTQWSAVKGLTGPETAALSLLLARAYMAQGNKKEALRAIARAVETGYRKRKSLWTDPGFRNLRNSKSFRASCGIR